MPMERFEASATTSSTGNWRSARMSSISRPTLPVAPTTATLKPMAFVLLLKLLPARLSCGPAKINLSESRARPPTAERCGRTLQFKSILTLFGVFPAW